MTPNWKLNPCAVMSRCSLVLMGDAYQLMLLRCTNAGERSTALIAYLSDGAHGVRVSRAEHCGGYGDFSGLGLGAV
jgi:hypothetical protein